MVFRQKEENSFCIYKVRLTGMYTRLVRKLSFGDVLVDRTRNKRDYRSKYIILDKVELRSKYTVSKHILKFWVNIGKKPFCLCKMLDCINTLFQCI